jgi:thioredoxin 1
MIYYNTFMKKCSLYFIIFIIIVIIALSGWFSINGDFEKEEASESEFNIIDTAGSLSEALQKAKTSDKQVFAVFESDTCTYCHQLRQNTLNDAQVMEKLNESYVVVIINVNDSPEIASKYNVYSTPTMLILDNEGNELKSIEGYYGPEDLIKMI